MKRVSPKNKIFLVQIMIIIKRNNSNKIQKINKNKNMKKIKKKIYLGQNV
jgi:hypothetical protein